MASVFGRPKNDAKTALFRRACEVSPIGLMPRVRQGVKANMSRRAAGVAVMQTADMWKSHDVAAFRRLDFARDR